MQRYVGFSVAVILFIRVHTVTYARPVYFQL